MARIPFLFAIAAMTIAGQSAQSDTRADYLLHCGGCHRPSGEGLPPEVPTLVDDIGKLMAIPEGRSYVVRVPGASQAPVSDQQLADIVNWILTEFNEATLPKDFQPLTAKEVGDARSNTLADPVKYRRQFWGSDEYTE